jgi:hypothetical protein
MFTWSSDIPWSVQWGSGRVASWVKWQHPNMVNVLNTHRIHVCYTVYDDIYHQYTPNVSIYTIHGSYGIWTEEFWCDFQQTDVIVLTKKWPGTSRLFLPNQQVSEATRDLPRKPNLSYLLKSETQHIRHSAINLLIRFKNTRLFSRVAKILSSKWLSMGPWKPNRPPIVTSQEWTIVYFGMLPVEYTNWRGLEGIVGIAARFFPAPSWCQVPAPLVSRLPAACGIVVAGASEITGNQQETHVAKWQWGSVTYHDIFGGQMAQKIIVQISAVLKHIPHFERTPSSTRQFHHHVVFTAILTVGGRQLWSRKHQRS